MRSEEIHYALDGTNEVVSVHDLTPARHRGLRCGCVCAGCQEPLVARLGEKRRWHFAHAPGSPECGHGAESGLHLMAKKLIQEEGVVTHPPHTITCTMHDQAGNPHSLTRTVTEAIHRVTATDIRHEVSLSGMVADIQLEDAQGPLLVEVAVSHKIDDEKREKLAVLGWRCIEIDLGNVSRHSTPAELRKILFNSERSTWAYHPDTADHAEALQAELRAIVDRANRELRRDVWISAQRAEHEELRRDVWMSDQRTEIEEMSADRLAKQIWYEKFQEWQSRQAKWFSRPAPRPNPIDDADHGEARRVHPKLETKRRPELAPSATPSPAPRLDMAAIQQTVDLAVRRTPARPPHMGIPPKGSADSHDPVLQRWQAERDRIDLAALQQLAWELRGEMDNMQRSWEWQRHGQAAHAGPGDVPRDIPACLEIPLEHEWLIAPSPPQWQAKVVQHLRQRASDGRKGGVPVPLQLASLRGYGIKVVEPYCSAQAVVDTLHYYRLERCDPELVDLMTALPSPQSVLNSFLGVLEGAAVIERRQLRGRPAYVMRKGTPGSTKG